MRSFMKYIIPVVFMFALLGLGYQLIFNAAGFLINLLVIAGFAGLIFLVIRWVMARRYGTSLFPARTGPTRAQLRKAKRTSSKKTESAPSSFLSRGAKTVQASKSKPARLTKHKTANPHLTVIEGKKNKKKNRALF